MRPLRPAFPAIQNSCRVSRGGRHGQGSARGHWARGLADRIRRHPHHPAGARGSGRRRALLLRPRDHLLRHGQHVPDQRGEDRRRLETGPGFRGHRHQDRTEDRAGRDGTPRALTAPASNRPHRSLPAAQRLQPGGPRPGAGPRGRLRGRRQGPRRGQDPLHRHLLPQHRNGHGGLEDRPVPDVAVPLQLHRKRPGRRALPAGGSGRTSASSA